MVEINTKHQTSNTNGAGDGTAAPGTEALEAPARDMATVMAYDAMRICLGQKPHHYSTRQVIRWMEILTEEMEKLP